MRQPYQTIDGQHRQIHGIDMPGTLTDWGRRADAIVQFSVPSFEYPRSDTPANLHYYRRVVRERFPGPTPRVVG